MSKTFEKLVSIENQTDLTGDDIRKLTNKNPIMYSQLKNYSSIDEVLGKEGYAVILYEVSKFSGHYVAVYRRLFDGQLCFADSYGYSADTEQQLGASYDLRFPKYLSELFHKSGEAIDENPFDYQRKASRIATCGRYATFFCLVGRHMTFKEIHVFLTQNHNAFLIPDHIVTMMTMIQLHDVRSFFDKDNHFPPRALNRP